MDKVIDQLNTIIKLEEYLCYEVEEGYFIEENISISPSIIKEYYNVILEEE
jgi:hypothetical protein